MKNKILNTLKLSNAKKFNIKIFFLNFSIFLIYFSHFFKDLNFLIALSVE